MEANSPSVLKQQAGSVIQQMKDTGLMGSSGNYLGPINRGPFNQEAARYLRRLRLASRTGRV